MSEIQRDAIEVQPASPQDANERRALLLHFGDVVESIGCVLKCAERYTMIGEAAADEESLAGFPILGLVTPQLTPHDFAARAATAFFLWTKELLEPTLNRELLAYTVQHDLFAGNQSGWDSYVALLRAQVPWFGEGLDRSLMPKLSSRAPQSGQPARAGNAALFCAMLQTEAKTTPSLLREASFGSMIEHSSSG